MSANVPENLLYTKEHEWALHKDGVVTIGITDFAQSSLGDIVFLELPELGSQLDQGTSFGVVESIKSVSDLYAPISGEVVEVNSELVDSPESINQNSYESWMVKIAPSNEAQISELMKATDYQAFCDSLS